MYYIELKMKKKLIVAAGIVIVAAAALCIKVSKEIIVSNELFEKNVEALTRVENDYQKEIWIVYEHGNVDFNILKVVQEVADSICFCL